MVVPLARQQFVFIGGHIGQVSVSAMSLNPPTAHIQQIILTCRVA